MQSVIFKVKIYNLKAQGLNNLKNIQDASLLVDITAGGDFLGLCDQKSSYKHCLILDGYGVMTA